MRSFRVNVSGRSYLVEVDNPDASPINVRVDGSLYQVTVEWRGADAEATVTPEVIPAQPQADAFGPRTDRPPLPPRPVITDVERQAAATLESPMPGTIVAVAVKAGDEVERGQEICVLEAMKMRNSIKSTRPGVIAEVLVTAGSKVAYGDHLVRFAPEAGEG